MKVLIQDYKIRELLKMSGSILSCVLSGHRIPNAFKIAVSRRLKLTRSLGFPNHILIEPARACNYKCPQCPRQSIASLHNCSEEIMSFERYKKIIDELGKYIFTLRLWDYGEPLMNPEIAKFVEYAKKFSIFTAISSNCSLLDEKKAAGLINAQLDYLLVSINAASPQTYWKLTGGAVFDRVIQNIRQLAELKKKFRSAKPFINLQFIVMKDNITEIEDMRELAKTLNIDKLSFKNIGFKSAEFGVKELFDDFMAKIRDSAEFCRLPFSETVIAVDGKVRPCAWIFDESIVMGNIYNESFADIWNGAKYREFRKLVLQSTDAIPSCKNCPKRNNPDFYLDSI